MSSKGKESNKKMFVAKGLRGWNGGFSKEFVNICRMDQTTLKLYLEARLRNAYGMVAVGDGYIYAPGNDVVVTAHMDTVHAETVKTVYGFRTEDKMHAIHSPQGIGGDDRCGIYMILQIIKQGYRPTVIFCEDEEIGGVGSGKFCKTEYLDDLTTKKFMIELDRANANDLVFYDDDNKEFHDWCEKVTGYKEAYGSFSDISNLCPNAGVSGVNISCGYYNAHTTAEYVVLEEMEASIDAAIKLIEASNTVEQFEYVQYYGNSYLSRYYNYNYAKEEYNYEIGLEVQFFDEDKKENDAFVTGKSEGDCWYTFFYENPTVCWNDIYDWQLW